MHKIQKKRHTKTMKASAFFLAILTLIGILNNENFANHARSRISSGALIKKSKRNNTARKLISLQAEDAATLLATGEETTHFL